MAINIPIITEFDGKGIDRAVKEFQNLEGAGAKAGFLVKKAALPAAAAIGGLAVALGDATKAAMEDQAAQAQLALTLQNTTGATDAQIKSAEDFISTLALASGVADDQLRPALAELTRGTKDVAEAQDTLKLAMDISTATGKDLGTVSEALSKAYQGNMKGLRSLSPEMATAIKEGADLETVMSILGGTFGGATAIAAGTAEGQFKRLGVALGEAKESIGAALLPVVEQLVPYLIKMGEFAMNNTGLFLGFAGVIGGLAVAILAVNAAMKVYQAFQVVVTAAQWAWNAALTANPIGLVVVAIAALIAAVVVAYNKFDWFKNGVNAVFGAIQTVITTGIDFVTGYVEGVLGLYKTLFNAIARLWNNTIGRLQFTIPDWVPGIGGKGFSVPNIPMLAEGGIVTGPTLALIGEAGPEAVIPLNRGGGGLGNVTINVNGGLGTSAEIGAAIVNALRQYNQAQGPAPFQVA